MLHFMLISRMRISNKLIGTSDVIFLFFKKGRG